MSWCVLITLKRRRGNLPYQVYGFSMFFFDCILVDEQLHLPSCFIAREGYFRANTHNIQLLIQLFNLISSKELNEVHYALLKRFDDGKMGYTASRREVSSGNDNKTP